MWTLLNPRLWIAGALALALIASHIAAYRFGASSTQQKWDAATTAQAKATLAASEANRVKEKTLNLAVERVRNELIKVKAARAADAAITTGRLRDLTAALASAAGANPAATDGADDPRGAIAGECSVALTTLDGHAQSLAGQVTGLQDYVRTVCTLP